MPRPKKPKIPSPDESTTPEALVPAPPATPQPSQNSENFRHVPSRLLARDTSPPEPPVVVEQHLTLSLPAATPTTSRVTRTQARWLMSRLTVETDEDACVASKIPLPIVREWFTDPESGFAEIFDRVMSDQIEAYRTLVATLNARVVAVLDELLDSDKETVRLNAAQTVLRSQGLMQTREADKHGSLTRLMDLLRQQRPIDVVSQPAKP